NGLAMLPPKKFHPFALDTFGLAKVLQSAAAKGAVRCLIGIGGSATNDGGFGVARGLCWKFLRKDGSEISRWPELDRLHQVCSPKTWKLFPELTVAVDVANPLLGSRGCSAIYGPQKGLLAKDIPVADKLLKTFAQHVSRQ